jgi:hypothetical protein
MSGEQYGRSLGQVEVVCVPSQGMHKLHSFAVEKRAQRKRKMFNLKYSIKSCIF